MSSMRMSIVSILNNFRFAQDEHSSLTAMHGMTTCNSTTSHLNENCWHMA
jgi:hypothetical protein